MKRIINTLFFLVSTVMMMAQGQTSFVVVDKNGNSQLVPQLIFQPQQGTDRYSWNSDGNAAGDIKDLLFVARAKAELATASSEDVTKILEEFSGTGQADAQAVAAALKNNPNVEDSYTEDGDNLIVKYKGSEGDVVYPMYEVISPFSDLQLPEQPNYLNYFKKTPRKASRQYPKVAIFNLFEDMDEYRVQNMITRQVWNYFNAYGYDTYYFTPNEKENLKFTYNNLMSVIDHSEDYAAIIVMTHGAKVDGKSCLCTGEEVARKEYGLFNPADRKYYKRYPSDLQAKSNCILYLGICDGLFKDNFDSLSPTIGYSGPTCMAQANAAILFYLMLEEGYSLEKAVSALYPDPAPNQNTKIYKSNNIGDQQLESDNSYLNREYLRGYSVEYWVRNRDPYTTVLGIISGYEGNMPKVVRMYFMPILGYNPAEQDEYRKLKDFTWVKDGQFNNDFTFRNLPENLYICRIYNYNGKEEQLIEPKLYKFRICSENYKENSAEVEATEESITAPAVLGNSGQPVEEITIPAGSTQTYQLDAYPGHTFETPCYDKNVAMVSLDGTTLTVTGVSEGSTFFGIFDRQNHKMAVVNVTVTEGGDTPPASYLTCPDDHHPHLIDLGLPSGTKWACCNVGATTPEGYGGYYAWGETEEKDYYDYKGNNYTHWDDSSHTCHDLESDIAGSKYDVAHVKWGSSWVMPSYDQQNELRENCSSEWTTINGINGRIFTGSNGGCIFLPAAGYRWNDYLLNIGSHGYYWSSTESPIGDEAYEICIYSGNVKLNYHYINFGKSVRPVVSGSPSTDMNIQLSYNYVELFSDQDYEVEIISGSGSYTVESSDEEVVSAYLEDNMIYIRGAEEGYATITVTDTKTGEIAILEVSVVAPFFYFSEDFVSMKVGETAKVFYENNTDFGYSCSDESVVTVDHGTGYFLINAVGPGSATIEVDYGFSPNYQATLEVVVTGDSASVSYKKK